MRLRFAYLLYCGLIPVIIVRQVSLHLLNADPETSQVALFCTFFLVAYIHSSVLLGFWNTNKIMVLIVTLWWLAELLGLRTGLIFGSYVYTRTLGYSLLGVPLIIPLVWFSLFYGARWTAQVCIAPLESKLHFFDSRRGVWIPIVLTAILLVIWDLAMDIHQVHEGRWIWQKPGIWFGIPLHNFLGWFIVAVIIQAVLKNCRITVQETHPVFCLAPVCFYLSIIWLATLQLFVLHEFLAGIIVFMICLVVTLVLVFRIISWIFQWDAQHGQKP